jgi:hypothetical protein
LAVDYKNRIGKTYYLREGKTKTGKPRYFFSSKQHGKGEEVEHIPEGYEIYEHPENAQVFLRKKRPQLITDIEKQLVKRYVQTLRGSKRYLLDCQDDCITVYESNADIGDLKSIFSHFMQDAPIRPGITVDDAVSTLVSSVDRYYTAMLRFRLVDKEERKFMAERFCFRGSIDDWIHLGGPDDLKELARRYIGLLGTDKFFDSPFFF